MKNTSKATIIETAQQTADKLIVELQHTYPGVAFTMSVYEEKDIANGVVPHIIIEWEDGPTSMDVDKTVYPYLSTDDAQFEHPHGYFLKGQHYIGAYYIDTQRNVSAERKEKVMKVARSFGYNEKTASNFQMELWEEDLVANRELSK